MALPAQTQLRYWGIAAVVLSVVLWFLGDVLLPFILGGAIAYFLDPVADRLERAGLSRAMATAVITVLAALLFVVVALAVVPALVRQTIQLIETAPQLFRDLQEFLTTRFPDLITEGSPVRETLASLGETVKERGGELANTALSSAMSFINILLLFVIVPVVAVYLLLDWDNMVARVDELLPREHAPTIRALARDVDATLAGFIRGMGSVCLILGTYYAVALMLVGLQFGLVVGFVSKSAASEALMHQPRGTFLMRFSDSELGGVSVSWNVVDGATGTSKVYNLQPWFEKDLAIRSLPDCIKDLDQLRILYPGTPKDDAFAKYYSEEKVVVGDGDYVRATINAAIIGDEDATGTLDSIATSSTLSTMDFNTGSLEYDSLAAITGFPMSSYMGVGLDEGLDVGGPSGVAVSVPMAVTNPPHLPQDLAAVDYNSYGAPEAITFPSMIDIEAPATMDE